MPIHRAHRRFISPTTHQPQLATRVTLRAAKHDRVDALLPRVGMARGFPGCHPERSEGSGAKGDECSAIGYDLCLVTLSAAKGLSRRAARCFAALSMTKGGGACLLHACKANISPNRVNSRQRSVPSLEWCCNIGVLRRKQHDTIDGVRYRKSQNRRSD